MMFSKCSLEGELLIDHRAGGGTDFVPAGRRFECATYTCCGCQAAIVRNPLRTRARNYCSACDRYMCDTCSLRLKLIGVHESFEAFANRYLNAAAKGKELPKWPVVQSL